MVKLVGWSKCTEVNLIALEAVTKLGMVDLENSPVLHETMFTDVESNGWGVVQWMIWPRTQLSSFFQSLSI